MLRDVFAECLRVLEPGGRIVRERRQPRSQAVPVAGRRRHHHPAGRARDAAARRDHLGEGEGRGGLVRVRFVHEGVEPRAARRHRARGRSRRRAASTARSPEGARASSGLPHESDDHARTSSSRRRSTCGRSGPSGPGGCKHPAPFPVELPERLIRLYTYVGDVVLDPFLGSGSTAVAAVRTGRHYVGYDTDPEYIGIAEAASPEARRDDLAD